MSGCGCGCGSCAYCNPIMPRPEFPVFDAEEQSHTLAASFTNCVDEIRNLYTCFGLRPYQVMLVHTRWSSGDRESGGTEEVISVEPIVPTPLITELTGLQATLQVVGNDETGTIRLTEISQAYSEEKLRGLGQNGEPIPQDQNFYYEVHQPASNGEVIRRRFFPRSPPMLVADQFQWQVVLIRQSEDRLRNGTPEG